MAFEAIRQRLEEDPGRPRVLCGDFNAPWAEDDDGPRVERSRSWLTDGLRRRSTEAEDRVLRIPEMRDVYRDVHVRGIVRRCRFARESQE